MTNIEKPASGEKPANARRHITTACLPCREVKTKCDGKTPTCGQCATKNRLCSYKGIDKRKVSVRKAVEAFSARVSQLESFITSNNLEVPPPTDDRQAVLELLRKAYHVGSGQSPSDSAQTSTALDNEEPYPKADGGTQSPRVVDNMLATGPPPTGQTPDLDQLHPNEMPQSMVWPLEFPTEILGKGPDINQFSPGSMTVPLLQDAALDADWVWGLSTMPQLSADIFPDIPPPRYPINDFLSSMDQMSSSQDISPPTLTQDLESTDDEEQSAVTTELSARLGALVFTGNDDPHYYGATSNLSLVRSRVAHISAGALHKRTSNAQEILDAQGLGQAIEKPLVDRLVSLYFSWHEPSMHTVDREAFEDARRRYHDENIESTFFSLMLLNAICAIGASFDTRRQTAYPTPMAEFFANRAKALLDMELNHPRVATVQALAVLSSHEAGYARDSRGWLFSGMSIRLAFDLGLHLDATPYVSTGSMTAQEAKGRAVALWGCFATDRMWGLYLGRPSYSRMETITATRPSSSSWNSVGDDTQLSNIFTDKWIELYEIMHPLEQSMYFQVEASNLDLQVLAEKTFNRLVSWKSTLDPKLSLDMRQLSSLPHDIAIHIIMLHMQFAFLNIILHRPFVAKHYIQPYPPIGRGHLHAREMSVRSATDIAKLLSVYENRFSLRQANVQIVHITFTAALILVYATVSENNPQSHQELSLHLETCCHALACLGEVFESATRTLDVLLSVKRTWQARLVAAVGSKRRRSSRTTGADQKRRAGTSLDVASGCGSDY